MSRLLWHSHNVAICFLLCSFVVGVSSFHLIVDYVILSGLGDLWVQKRLDVVFQMGAKRMQYEFVDRVLLGC